MFRLQIHVDAKKGAPAPQLGESVGLPRGAAFFQWQAARVWEDGINQIHRLVVHGGVMP